jgi:hypothetical protein
MNIMPTPLREISFFFKDGTDLGKVTIEDIKPEILSKKAFSPSDLNRAVVEIADIVSTNVAFDGQITSKFNAPQKNKGEPGVLYPVNNFLHYDKKNKSLFVFQDYDASGNVLENMKGLDANDKIAYFSPENIYGAYDNNLIKTYTDNH